MPTSPHELLWVKLVIELRERRDGFAPRIGRAGRQPSRLGRAAHAMSPIGGVGINLAVQDAVAAANILAEPHAKAP